MEFIVSDTKKSASAFIIIYKKHVCNTTQKHSTQKLFKCFLQPVEYYLNSKEKVFIISTRTKEKLIWNVKLKKNKLYAYLGRPTWWLWRWKGSWAEFRWSVFSHTLAANSVKNIQCQWIFLKHIILELFTIQMHKSLFAKRLKSHLKWQFLWSAYMDLCIGGRRHARFQLSMVYHAVKVRLVGYKVFCFFKLWLVQIAKCAQFLKLEILS
jgi:hypothetical protein